MPTLPITSNTVEPLPITDNGCDVAEADTINDPVIDVSPTTFNILPSNVKLASPLKGVVPFPVAVTIKLSVLFVIAVAALVPCAPVVPVVP